MGLGRTVRTIEPKHLPLSFELPRLRRKRPRCFEEWSALRRWGRLPDQEQAIIGFRLREARERAGLTQIELARRLGCSQQAVSQAERWSSNPTVEFLRSWAMALGAELEIEFVAAKESSRNAVPGTTFSR